MEKIEKLHKNEVQKLHHQWEADNRELLKEISKNKANTEKVNT